MTDEQPASPAPPAPPDGVSRSDDRDPLAMFPTESEVAAVQKAEARAAARKDRARTVAAIPVRIRRRDRLWPGLLVVAVLLVAGAAAAWLAFPDVASGIRGRLAGAAASSPATLMIETTPPGWEVAEGDRRLGATPLTISLPSGTHALVLRHGAATRPLAVTLTPGAEVVHHLDMTEAPPAATEGALHVITVPAGATVSLDGAPRGAAPLHIANLAPGDHTIVVANAYRVVNQKVTVTPGETTTLLVPLGQPPAPAPPAPVAVASPPVAVAPPPIAVAPPPATVGWVAVSAAIELQVYEGESLIGSSRNQRIVLIPGQHTLRMVNTALGFETTTAVTVRAGATETVTIQVPNGSLSVNAAPWAEVVLDGTVIGETPIANYAVTLGSHELVLRNPRYPEQRRTVVVSLSSPAFVGVDLRQ